MVTLDDLLKTLKRVDVKNIGDRIIQEAYEAAKNPDFKSIIASWEEGDKLIFKISTKYITKGIISKNKPVSFYDFPTSRMSLSLEDAAIRSIKKYFNKTEVNKAYNIKVYDNIDIQANYEMKILDKNVIFHIYGRPDLIIYCYPKKNYESLTPIIYIFEIKTYDIKGRKGVNIKRICGEWILQTIVYKILLEDALRNSSREGLPSSLRNVNGEVKIKYYLLVIEYSLGSVYHPVLLNHWRKLFRGVKIYEIDKKLEETVRKEMMEFLKRIAEEEVKKQNRKKERLKSFINNLRNF